MVCEWCVGNLDHPTGTQTYITDLTDELISLTLEDGSSAGGVPRPTGPFRLLEGGEYAAARRAANSDNQQLHADAGGLLKGLQVHEIQPVKFGGSPVDSANKIALAPADHAKYTVWWNRLQRGLDD